MSRIVSPHRAPVVSYARPSRAPIIFSALIVALPASRARADDGQTPYEVPRQTMIPGTPGMPGGIHLMMNAFGHGQNEGLGGHEITNQGVHGFDGGKTYPLLTDDWVMAYGRDSHGYVEGLLMLDFEPFSVGPAGYPEIGQSGEGLWDAQHSHQLLHQAMVAIHPLAGLDGWHPVDMMHEGDSDLTFFGGQGSATIGPPIFMHRASSPGPSVPRKHHKGENPHETFPVLGASLRIRDTWFEASAFSGKELTPEDSRFYPHVAAPSSFAARIRHDFGPGLEIQLSAERLRDQGTGAPDATQASASAYGWTDVDGWRLDGLLDWALDRDDAVSGKGSVHAQALLGELAGRAPGRRQTYWVREELNQREESPALGGAVSSPWLFETVGFEQLVVGGRTSGIQIGVFAEATLVHIPSSLEAVYGTETAVTIDAGLHLFGMWMLDGNGQRMEHGHGGMLPPS